MLRETRGHIWSCNEKQIRQESCKEKQEHTGHAKKCGCIGRTKLPRTPDVVVQKNSAKACKTRPGTWEGECAKYYPALQSCKKRSLCVCELWELLGYTKCGAFI
jgi:hypothetical protein